MRKAVGKSNSPYTQAYKDKCKIAWYEAGRMNSIKQFMEIIPLDEWGRKPHFQAVLNWRDEEGWDIWADELDARTALQIDDLLVAQRVLMLQEQASRARDMQKMGIEYLREHDFDSSASAVNAVVQGSRMERTSRGISERLEKLLMMDDEALTKEVAGLLNQAKDSGEVLDMDSEDVEEENDEETES